MRRAKSCEPGSRNGLPVADLAATVDVVFLGTSFDAMFPPGCRPGLPRVLPSLCSGFDRIADRPGRARRGRRGWCVKRRLSALPVDAVLVGMVMVFDVVLIEKAVDVVFVIGMGLFDPAPHQTSSPMF